MLRHLILGILGDFFQLPPVANAHYWDNCFAKAQYADNGEFCFQSEVFKDIFPHIIVLTYIIRQSEQHLIQAIHSVCQGQLTEETDTYIKGLSRPLGEGDSVKMFAKNDYVNDFNRRKILGLPWTEV